MRVTPEIRFDQIVDELVMLGVVAGHAFGHRAAMVQGRVAAVLWTEGMAFRLGEETQEHAHALSLDGSDLFDPSGKDQPFTDWVLVPFAHQDEWGHLAEVALRRLYQKL